MDKEKLFKEYAAVYKNYLYGKCSYDDTYAIIEQIDCAVFKEASKIEGIKDIVSANNIKIDKIQEEVKNEYENNIVKPTVEELLDFLQFEGLVTSSQYIKKAQELKEKLQKYDGLFIIRERALMKFFSTKIGSKYSDYDKMRLTLRLGALETRNL